MVTEREPVADDQARTFARRTAGPAMPARPGRACRDPRVLHTDRPVRKVVLIDRRAHPRAHPAQLLGGCHSMPQPMTRGTHD